MGADEKKFAKNWRMYSKSNFHWYQRMTLTLWKGRETPLNTCSKGKSFTGLWTRETSLWCWEALLETFRFLFWWQWQHLFPLMLPRNNNNNNNNNYNDNNNYYYYYHYYYYYYYRSQVCSTSTPRSVAVDDKVPSTSSGVSFTDENISFLTVLFPEAKLSEIREKLIECGSLELTKCSWVRKQAVHLHVNNLIQVRMLQGY